MGQISTQANTMLYLAYIVLGLSFINLLRMAFFAIASDIFDIKNNIKNKSSTFNAKSSRKYSPLVTVVVPAHNEELTLRRNLESIVNSTYKNIQLIIVNDSSTDRTYNIARYFQRKNRKSFKQIKVLNVKVRGKAKALNAALEYAEGSLFMCLDSDSALTPDALQAAVGTFKNKEIGALSASVKIFPTKGLLNTIQRIEYLICYQMKKAETLSGIQYIIGGIGSMYRTNLLKKLGNYDTDTITEDIDLSMQLLEVFGSKYKIGYNPNVVVFTESVVDISGLMVQRYRWKYGRYQVFLKRRSMFWNTGKSTNYLLSWIYLPYALLAEIIYSLEPLVILFLFYILVVYGDTQVIIGTFLTFFFYNAYLISGATQGYSLKERIKLCLYAPVAYVGMYILSYVEYLATIKGIYKFPELIRNHKTGAGNCEWTHVTRTGIISK